MQNMCGCRQDCVLSTHSYLSDITHTFDILTNTYCTDYYTI